MPKVLLYCLLISFHGVVSSANHSGARYDFSSFSYSEAVSVRSALNEWKGHFFGGGKAFTYNQSNIGFYYNQIRFSLIYRYDYEIKFAPDTAEFFYLTKNKKELQIGRNYELDIEVKNHYSRGFQLNYDYQFNKNLTLWLGAAYLQGQRLTDGRLNGQVQVLAANDYDFDFDLAYYYSEDALLERKVKQPKGDGYATDIGLSWQGLPQWRLSVTIKDLYSRIHWRKTPITIGKASSDVKQYDDDGYVIYAAALSGSELNRDFIQTLSTRYYINSTYQYNAMHINAEVAFFPLQTIYTLGSAYSLNKHWRVSAAYLMPVDAFRIGVEGYGFYLRLIADQIDIMDSNTVGLDVGFKISL